MSALGLDTPPFSVPSSPAASTTSTSSILRARAPLVGTVGLGRFLDTAGAATAAVPFPSFPVPLRPLGFAEAVIAGDSTELGDFLSLPLLAGVPLPLGLMGLAREAFFMADVGGATAATRLTAAVPAPALASTSSLPPVAAAAAAAAVAVP